MAMHSPAKAHVKPPRTSHRMRAGTHLVAGAKKHEMETFGGRKGYQRSTVVATRRKHVSKTHVERRASRTNTLTTFHAPTNIATKLKETLLQFGGAPTATISTKPPPTVSANTMEVLQKESMALPTERLPLPATPMDRNISHSPNMREYMVELEQPLGITFARGRKGDMYVLSIDKEGSAHASKLISVGDVVRRTSAVYGDEMWEAKDYRRVLSAITRRKGAVKLVLERGAAREEAQEAVLHAKIANAGHLPGSPHDRRRLRSRTTRNLLYAQANARHAQLRKSVVKRAFGPLGCCTDRWVDVGDSCEVLDICIKGEELPPPACSTSSHSTIFMGDSTVESLQEILPLAAAKLHRMMGKHKHSPDMDVFSRNGHVTTPDHVSSHSSSACRISVLVRSVCGNGAVAATCIAAYLAWYRGLSIRDAEVGTAQALGLPVVGTALRAAAEDLLVIGMSRQIPARPRAVVLWVGEASTVSVAGEFLGNWEDHVEMDKRRMQDGRTCFVLDQQFAIPQGHYAFKFIVDGVWSVSAKYPVVEDDRGNENNLLRVGAHVGAAGQEHDRWSVFAETVSMMSLEERLSVTRMEALTLAFTLDPRSLLPKLSLDGSHGT